MNKLIKCAIALVAPSIAITAISAFTTPQALAGNSAGTWTWVPNQVQTRTQAVSVQQPRIFHQEKLNYSPNLAYIPTYTGRNFITVEAIHCTGLPTGECYNVTYLSQEDKAAVHMWYRESLRQCGWTIDEASSTDTAITATRSNGLTCFVYTRPSTQKQGYACEAIVRLSIRSN